MTIQEEWKITRLLGSNDTIETVEFYCVFTDPERPGAEDATAGTIRLDPLTGNLDAETATLEEIVGAIKFTLGDRWVEMLAFHDQQLTFEYGRLTGQEFDTSRFTPAPTPEEIRAAMPALTARQLRLGLIEGGFSLSQVESAIQAIPDQADREKAQVEWEYASSYLRTNPLLNQIAISLGLTDEQVDALWQQAQSL